jgi:hypothetical protein
MEVRVSKGFIVLAQNTESVDYIKQAYALALSIKGTQTTITNISLVTNDTVPDNYKQVFDQIIEIPWGDLAKNPQWKVENRWKLYHASPYDETIVLDTDMLFIDDISSWWDYCCNSDLKFCSKIKNYKDEIVEHDMFHRKTFINNQLPNPYVALYYFKKSDLAHNFFKVLEFVVKNWEYCSKTFTPKNPQLWLSIDLATAIAIDLMGIEEQVIDLSLPFEFVHMKPAIQNWSPVPSTWQNIVPFNFNNGKLIVGNHRQHYLFHYVEKDFLDDNLLKKIEVAYG